MVKWVGLVIVKWEGLATTPDTTAGSAVEPHPKPLDYDALYLENKPPTLICSPGRYKSLATRYFTVIGWNGEKFNNSAAASMLLACAHSIIKNQI